MRILHVIPSMSLVHGGPSQAISMMERALSGGDIKMEVATTDDDGPGRRLQGRFGADGLRLGREAPSLIRRYFSRRTEFYKISPGLGWWLVRHARDYDIIHIHALFSFSSIAAAWAARRAGVPYIVRPLGTLTHYGVEKRRPWLKRLSLKWLEGPILRHAAAVHFTAEAERIEAEALGIPFRAAVIPLAVEASGTNDAAMFAERFPVLRDKPYLLFLSRLDPKKNLEGLLGAMATLAEQFPDLMLAIAGDGEPGYVAGLKKQAEELGIASRVVWTGFVDGELKAAALADAQLFVLPSYSENFGIAAAEAMLAGLPCVLGKGVAIAAEVAVAGAGRITDTDAQAIAATLTPFLEDADLRKQAGDAAKAYAEQTYSVKTMGERLAALYRSVCAQAQ